MKINPIQAQIVRFISQLHATAYRLSGGWGWLNRNALILTTRGRKSGREISKPLFYFEAQGRIYLVASYGGNDAAPAWYLNLVKTPEVKVQVGSSVRSCRARTLSAAEAQPIWPGLLAIYPAYAEYQKKTTRQIPIVELAPA